MNDTEKLPTNIQDAFKEIPGELSLSYNMIDASALVIPDSLFDSKTPLQEDDLLDTFLPLIVAPIQREKFIIIDGCKRFLKSKEQNRDKISCKIIETSLDDLATGLLRIFLNHNRQQHIREKFQFFSWLKKNYSATEFKRKANRLGFSSKAIQQFTLLASSEQYTKEAFLNNFLDISQINSLLIFTKEDQRVFLETFKEFSLSFQTQREFLEWLPEIAYVKKISVKEILAQPEIQEIFTSTTINDPQKLQKIRSLIYMQKYPRLSNAQQKWKELSTGLNPEPSCVSFEPDAYFEKNRLEVKISVTRPDKAVDIFSRLAGISSKEWKKLIYPL
jgi:hypothetical protein